MKLSVSLPEEDVEFLDAYAAREGIATRSAALHKAVRLLRSSELDDAYAAAWTEWDSDAANAGWDTTVADGVG